VKDAKKPILRVRGDTITVTSPYSKRSFKISKVDRALVENIHWSVVKNHNKLNVSRSPGYSNRKHIYLSRVIMSAKPGEFVMFRNRDTLDLRRKNLMICTRRQYAKNKCKTIKNTSGYKGVTWNKTSKNWRAVIGVDYKRIHIGYYNDPETAAKAYNRAAKILHEGFNYIGTNK
jgi:signal peptidase I